MMNIKTLQNDTFDIVIKMHWSKWYEVVIRLKVADAKPVPLVTLLPDGFGNLEQLVVDIRNAIEHMKNEERE